MILTDRAGHLVSDTSLEELHMFAARIGLRRSWFQGLRNKHPHYDLTTDRKKRRAIEEGAVVVSSKELVIRMKRTATPSTYPRLII